MKNVFKSYSANKTGIMEPMRISGFAEISWEVIHFTAGKQRRWWFCCSLAWLAPRSWVWATEQCETGHCAGSGQGLHGSSSRGAQGKASAPAQWLHGSCLHRPKRNLTRQMNKKKKIPRSCTKLNFQQRIIQEIVTGILKIGPARNQAVCFKTSIQGDAVLHDHFDITTSRYSLQKLLLVCSGSCLLRMGPRPPGSGCSSHRHKQASNSNCQRHFTKSFASSSWLSVLILQPRPFASIVLAEWGHRQDFWHRTLCAQNASFFLCLGINGENSICSCLAVCFQKASPVAT